MNDIRLKPTGAAALLTLLSEAPIPIESGASKQDHIAWMARYQSWYHHYIDVLNQQRVPNVQESV